MEDIISPLQYVNVKVDPSNYKNSVLDILTIVKPQWEQEDIKITTTSQGFANTLFKCSVKSDVQPVLVRVFGNNPSLDRESEIEILRILSHHGICAQYHCRFNNGLVYDYIKGKTLLRKSLYDERLCRQIAEQLHQIHQIDMNQYIRAEKRSNIIQQIGIRIKGIEDGDFQDVFNSERYKTMLPQFEELKRFEKEIIGYYGYLCEEYPTVFCHCDVHVHNIIQQEETDCLSFIDWETSGMCPEIYDAAILIERDIEFGDDFHDLASRRQWLQCYLSTHPVHGTQPITEQMLQKWYKDSLKASCVSLLMILLITVPRIKSPVKDLDSFSFGAYFYNIFKKYRKELEKLDE